MSQVSVSDEQVLYFRATGGHRAGKGASDVTEAANAEIEIESSD